MSDAANHITSLLGALDLNFERSSNQFGPFWVLRFVPEGEATELRLFLTANDWVVALHTLPALSDRSALSSSLLHLNMQLMGSKIALADSNPVVLGETPLDNLSSERLARLLAGVLVGVESVRGLLAREAGA